MQQLDRLDWCVFTFRYIRQKKIDIDWGREDFDFAISIWAKVSLHFHWCEIYTVGYPHMWNIYSWLPTHVKYIQLVTHTCEIYIVGYPHIMRLYFDLKLVNFDNSKVSISLLPLHSLLMNGLFREKKQVFCCGESWIRGNRQYWFRTPGRGTIYSSRRRIYQFTKDDFIFFKI